AARIGLHDAASRRNKVELLKKFLRTRPGLRFSQMIQPTHHLQILDAGQIFVYGRVLTSKPDAFPDAISIFADVKTVHQSLALARLKKGTEYPDDSGLAGTVRTE